MKLRLETGNFKITGVIDDQAQTATFNTLPKGLSPEDFVGCVLDLGNTGFSVVTQAVKATENTIMFSSGTAMQLVYNCLTGEVTLEE